VIGNRTQGVVTQKSTVWNALQ